MGWKTFFQMTQEQFKEKYEKAEKWGQLLPVLIQLTNATTENIYGAGFITDTVQSYTYSETIQHFLGAKTKLTAKYIIGFKAGATGKLAIYIGFYKNGEFSKDPEGHSLFGVMHVLDQALTYDVAEKHEFTVETQDSKITLYVDGEKIGEYQLESPLKSYVYALYIPELSGGTAFIAIYEVKGEYYDVFEDMINSMMNIMWIMMIVMIIVMGISMVVRAFRGKGS